MAYTMTNHSLSAIFGTCMRPGIPRRGGRGGWRSLEGMMMVMAMKEHTRTKTLFKLKHTYYRQSPRRRDGRFACTGEHFPLSWEGGPILCDGPKIVNSWRTLDKKVTAASSCFCLLWFGCPFPTFLFFVFVGLPMILWFCFTFFSSTIWLALHSCIGPHRLSKHSLDPFIYINIYDKFQW